MEATGPAAPGWSRAGREQVARMVRAMSLPEKIGQLFVAFAYGDTAATTDPRHVRQNRALLGVDNAAELVARRAVTLLRNSAGVLPLTRGQGQRILVTGYGTTPAADLAAALAAQGVAVSTVVTGSAPAPAAVAAAIEAARQVDYVVIISNSAWADPAQLRRPAAVPAGGGRGPVRCPARRSAAGHPPHTRPVGGRRALGLRAPLPLTPLPSRAGRSHRGRWPTIAGWRPTPTPSCGSAGPASSGCPTTRWNRGTARSAPSGSSRRRP